MKITHLILAVLILIAFASAVLAIPPGKSIDYDGKGAGKVTFDGKVHADKGLKCNDCHVKIFQMKKGAAKITMSEINTGKLCGACHNGEKAFKASDAANCTRCHKK